MAKEIINYQINPIISLEVQSAQIYQENYINFLHQSEIRF